MIARLTVPNHRGRDVPAVLGFALMAGGAGTAAIAIASGRVVTAGLVADAAAVLVFAAGLVDDLVAGRPRGIRGHLRELARGRVSSGVVKLIVVAAASVVTVATSPRPGLLVRVAGVALIAGSANLWNGLDVRPGRAIKFGLLALPIVLSFAFASAPFVLGVWLAGLVVLPWDVGERAMLGDAGSNLLGFAIGVAAYHAMPVIWIEVVAAVVLGLNVVAETVTLSRAIDAIPPLRWWDRLGRQPEP
jgi:UDP-GlcNAc:undecaprenyl-phosphate/decaprenyl-phosphate GlcNAc-1-phosphate transferase